MSNRLFNTEDLKTDGRLVELNVGGPSKVRKKPCLSVQSLATAKRGWQ